MYSISRFANSKRLPTLPEVAIRLVEIAQQDDPDINEVCRIVRSAPVISGKILKTVNSALFGFRSKVDTIEHAIPILGLTMLRTLILSFHLAGHKTHQQEWASAFHRLWRSSLTQAVFAELIAEKVNEMDPPSCFLVGLLQDIGVLAMLSESPEIYINSVLDRAKFPNISVAERNCFGFSHVDVSVKIVNQWGMGAEFEDAIRHHHDQVATPLKGNKLRSVLQAANLGTNLLLAEESASPSFSSSLGRWVGFLDDHFDLTKSKAEEVISEVNERVDDYSILFDFRIGENVEAHEVVVRAKDLLQELALKNQLEQVAQRKRKWLQRTNDDQLYRDSLTGLYNRRYVDERLNRWVTLRMNKGKPVAMLFIDVDKFKSINDGFGHSTGDKAIQHVAAWLTSSTRGGDIAIRLGGDEFLVMLDVADQKMLESVARRIASEIPPLELSSTSLEISLSVGATYYQPLNGEVADASWLIDKSDHSMYLAKHAGGGTISVQCFVGMEPLGLSSTH